MSRPVHRLHALTSTSKANLQEKFNSALDSVRDAGEQQMASVVGEEVRAYLLNWYHHRDAWKSICMDTFRVSTQQTKDRQFPALEVLFTQPYQDHPVGWGVITRKDIVEPTDKASRDHRQLMGTLRALVDDQIKEFRDANAASRPCNDAHVDHIYEFLYLTNDWATTVAGLASVDEVRTRRIPEGGAALESAEQARSWQDYHRQHAQLRWLTPLENCSRPQPSIRK